MNSGVDGPNPERESLRHRVKAAMAEGVAAQQAPSREQDSAQNAKAID
jgi:hypothetical protein